jgi:hypothetical protein
MHSGADHINTNRIFGVLGAHLFRLATCIESKTDVRINDTDR